MSRLRKDAAGKYLRNILKSVNDILANIHKSVNDILAKILKSENEILANCCCRSKLVWSPPGGKAQSSPFSAGQ